VKKIFFGTIAFPNFYVSSVSFKIVEFVKRSRMSLSHLGGLKQYLQRFHHHFTTAGS